MSQKPREFWMRVFKLEIDSKPSLMLNSEEEIQKFIKLDVNWEYFKVIEYSAYAQLQKELEESKELLRECEVKIQSLIDSRMFFNLPPVAQELLAKFLTKLRERNGKNEN